MKDLDQLLQEDQQEITEQATWALQAGLAQRLTKQAKAPSRVPLWIPAVAALFLVAGVVLFLMRHRSEQSPPSRVAQVPKLEQPVTAAASTRNLSPPKAVRVAQSFSHKKKSLAPTRPFEVPGASSEDERALLTLARAPSELQALALQQKTVMDDAYEKATEDFKTRTSKENSNDR